MRQTCNVTSQVEIVIARVSCGEEAGPDPDTRPLGHGEREEEVLKETRKKG